MSEMRTFQKYLGAPDTKGIGDGTFTATLTTFGNKDSDNDIVHHGALDKWLKTANELPMLYDHKRGEYIGKWSDFRIEKNALVATGQLFDYAQRSREVGEHIKRENLTGISIGFKSDRYDFREDEDGLGLELFEIQLLEASVVLFPANEQAQITAKAQSERESLFKSYRRAKMSDDTTNQKDALTSEDLDKATVEITKALEGKASQSDLEAIQKSVNEAVASALEKSNAEHAEKREAMQKEIDDLTVKSQTFAKGQPKYAAPTWKKSETRSGTSELEIRYGSKVTPEERTFAKAITTNDLTPGYRVDTIMPFVELEEANPLRPYQTNIPVDGGSFKKPQVGNLSYTKENTYTATRSDGATISSENVNIDTYTLQISVPEPAMQDVTGLRASMQTAFMYAAGKEHGENAVGTLIAGVHPASGTAPITNVPTGVAATLPTDTNFMAKATAVTQAIPTSYRSGSVFVISKPVEARLQALEKSDGAGFAFDPATGISTLLGWPVVVTDHLEDGATANDVSLVFGNLRMGLICGDSETFYMAEYSETKPGAITFFSRMRYVYTLWDTTGLAGWITKVS